MNDLYIIAFIFARPVSLYIFTVSRAPIASRNVGGFRLKGSNNTVSRRLHKELKIKLPSAYYSLCVPVAILRVGQSRDESTR